MIRYWADLLEKLIAGAFVYSVFRDEGGIWAIVIGLIFLGLWFKLRIGQIRSERKEGGK